MRIVVFGNSQFTLPSFAHLANHGLVAGLCMIENSEEVTMRIKHIAKQLQIPVLKVNRKNYVDRLKPWLEELAPDVCLVLTFSYKIPPELLAIPRLGFFNFHFAPLPKYRGPQPTFWEILNRESNGAIAVHKMDEDFDTGPLVAQMQVMIQSQETFGMHVNKLAQSGVQVMTQVVNHLIEDPGNLPLTPQEEEEANWYDKPTLNDLVIDWEEMDSYKVMALVQATNPWNKGAWTSVNQFPFRILDVKLVYEPGLPEDPPGTVKYADQEKGVVVVTKDKALLKISVIYIDEGYLDGEKLIQMGLRPGARLERPVNETVSFS